MQQQEDTGQERTSQFSCPEDQNDERRSQLALEHGCERTVRLKREGPYACVFVKLRLRCKRVCDSGNSDAEVWMWSLR